MVHHSKASDTVATPGLLRVTPADWPRAQDCPGIDFIASPPRPPPSAGARLASPLALRSSKLLARSYFTPLGPEPPCSCRESRLPFHVGD
ncbi:hypothetical protein N7468_004067 [Penicillium chermesinum]|uniref:Uncharacterized protein n=1 Tax=Penicillium chermesinum TaxID=63820 RepID=A0A9W9P7R5_9EURO|nr:uncharacterized protein N7468_004067 [Penicillium chermesinum]KAJ5239448.1 hypothetical protein N7468_004067 [Penicillium chermesinum]